MYSFDFNKKEYDYIIENCNFQNIELEIFNLKRKGYSVPQIAYETNISEATVNRKVKKIKNKIMKLI